MATFADALEEIAKRVPEAEVLMIIGTDGIPIDKLTVRPNADVEAVAAEHTTLLRASVSSAADTGLGALQELAVVTDRMTTLLVAITPRVFPVRRVEPRGRWSGGPVWHCDSQASASEASSTSPAGAILDKAWAGANNACS